MFNRWGLGTAQPMTSNSPKKRDLGRAIKQGAAWIFISRVLVFTMNFGGSVVLARLLEPRDFGVFGIALLLTGLGTRFGNIGFGLALVQREEISEKHISSLFAVDLLIFLSITGILVWISPFVGSYFENALAGDVLKVLAFIFLATPFSSIARAIMQREMNFKGPAFASTIQHLMTILAAIALAFSGFGVWSLVYGELFGAYLNAMILVLQSGWKPIPKYHHEAMQDLFSFGVGVFFKKLLVYGSEKIDFFVIGKRLGAMPLGFYEKGFNLMNLTVKELGNKMEPVLFRAFSVIQNDRERILKAYHKVLLTFSLVGCPVFLGLAAISPAFIYLVYGEKWMPMVLPFQVMCFSGFFRLHLKVTSTAFNAMGKIKVEVWIRSVAVALLFGGCWYGSRFGLIGVTVAETSTAVLLTVFATLYFSRLTGFSPIILIRPQVPALVSAALMYGIVVLFQNGFQKAPGVHSFPMLFSAIAVGIVSYAASLFLMGSAPVKDLLKEFAADLRPMVRRT